jgi:hypothetical protein
VAVKWEWPPSGDLRYYVDSEKYSCYLHISFVQLTTIQKILNYCLSSYLLHLRRLVSVFDVVRFRDHIQASELLPVSCFQWTHRNTVALPAGSNGQAKSNFGASFEPCLRDRKRDKSRNRIV